MGASSSLKKKNEELKQKNERLEERIKAKQNENERLNTEKGEINGEIELLRNDINEQRRRNEELNQQINALTNDINEQRRRNEELNQENTSLTNDINEQRRRNEEILRENEHIYKDFYKNIKSSKMINDSIATEELILHIIDIKLPKIYFDEKWILKKDSSKLDKDLKSFIDTKLTNKDYFSNNSDCNLNLPSKLLKEKKIELLTKSFTNILQKTNFINDCKKNSKHY